VYQQLATYLSQYKQVTIPQVGSFELVPKPAMLDVASKLIHPPGYLPQYSDRDFVKEHQLNFLALDLNADKEIVKEELENFGKDLKKKNSARRIFLEGHWQTGSRRGCHGFLSRGFRNKRIANDTCGKSIA
jgi:hypothetical protein